MTIKLTPAQLAVLRELAKPGALAFYVERQGREAWHTITGFHTRQLKALEQKHFVVVFKHIPTGLHAMSISNAGHAHLAELDGKQ